MNCSGAEVAVLRRWQLSDKSQVADCVWQLSNEPGGWL